MSSLSHAWLRYPVGVFARWLTQHDVVLPTPLRSSPLGRFRVPSPERTGVVAAPEVLLPESEQHMLRPVLQILARPASCGYVVREETDGPATYYAGLTGGDADDALVLVITPEQVRLTGTYPHHVADVVARELPNFRPAPIGRVELDSWRRSRIEAGEATYVSLGASAAAFSDWMQAVGRSPRVAMGAVDAIAYRGGRAGEIRRSGCTAHFVEFAQGGTMSMTTRRGGIVHEPLTVAAVRHALAEALASLD